MMIEFQTFGARRRRDQFGFEELGGVLSEIPDEGSGSVSLADVLRSRPDTAAPTTVEVPYDPERTASDRLGDLAGCPSGFGVIYATPEYGDELYTRKCRAVAATSAADIIRETRGGVSDTVLQTLFPTSDPGGPCAALDVACHLRGLRPYLVGGALLGGLVALAYIVRAFR